MYEGRGAQENDERCIDCVARRVSSQLKGGERLSCPYHFFFRAWVTQHLVESDCTPWLYLCCASLLDLLGPATRADAQNGKGLFQIPS
jgi:hypothetical protein